MLKETYGMTYEEEAEYLREIMIPELQADKDRILKDRAKIYRENGELRTRVCELEECIAEWQKDAALNGRW